MGSIGEPNSEVTPFSCPDRSLLSVCQCDPAFLLRNSLIGELVANDLFQDLVGVTFIVCHRI